MRFRYLWLAALLALAGGCALFPEEIDVTKEWTAKRLYEDGKQALKNADFDTAIDRFEKLEVRYPFDRYAKQAQLELAYAYYKFDEPASAIAACDRFIKLYPRHPNVDYAYYLKGLVNFNQSKGLLEKYLPSDQSKRDPGAAQDSFRDFALLVRKFPDSRYAKDAVQRMTYLRNNLARYELHVADYYMRRGAWVAAVNRAKYVLEHYARTPSVPEALVVMARSYRVLGLDDLADDALRVLELNHPGHPGIAEVRNLALE